MYISPNSVRTESRLANPSERRERPVVVGKTDKTTRQLKWGIWAYFLLLIFEGALRKWFLPSLATPLLIARDPIAFWLILTAWNHHRLTANPYLIGMVLIGVFSIFPAVIVGHGSFLVALFGARIFLLHFPLIFIIGQVFILDDVEKMGKVTLWIAIPMTVLIALQFYSPQSAWVNLGVGGDTAGAGFDGALGYFRPPATFSFTTGTTQFYSFAACFIFYFWLNPERINRLILTGASAGLLAAIPLSISRGLFFQVGVTMLFTVVAVSRKPKYAWRMSIASIGLLITLTLLSHTNFFQTATEAFSARYDSSTGEQSGGVQGAIIDRFFDGLIEAVASSQEVPFFGFGIGMGTNVGSQLISGKVDFLISEGEWGRIIGEIGPLMGLLVVLLRVSLTIKLSVASFKRLALGNLLPLMLLSNGILIMSQGNWGQPTSLGFSILIGGLLIASLKTENNSAIV